MPAVISVRSYVAFVGDDEEGEDSMFMSKHVRVDDVDDVGAIDTLVKDLEDIISQDCPNSC